jgi:hypothetical protein
MLGPGFCTDDDTTILLKRLICVALDFRSISLTDETYCKVGASARCPLPNQLDPNSNSRSLTISALMPLRKSMKKSLSRFERDSCAATWLLTSSLKKICRSPLDVGVQVAHTAD